MKSPFDGLATEERTAFDLTGGVYNLATVSRFPAPIFAHVLLTGKVRVHCMGQSVDLFPLDRVKVLA